MEAALLDNVVCADDTALDLPTGMLDVIERAGGGEATCVMLRAGSPPIGVFTIAGRDAVDAWTELRAIAPADELWPVIVGSGGALDFIIEAASYSEVEPIDALGQADSIDYPTWLADRTAALFGEDHAFPEDATVYPPEAWGEPDYAAVRDILSDEYLETVYVALVPARNSSDVAAELLFGCWNDNPCPAEHVAVLRHWHDTFGAEIVSMGEVLELRVARPPTDWDASLALAREMYVYDYDIVEQGTGTINALAHLLRNAPSWYFWWD